MIRLNILVTHPVQYQAPVWRLLASRPGLSTHVGFFSEQGVVATVDPGFGRQVVWDQPLLEGYAFEFITRRPIAELDRFSIPDPRQWFSEKKPDVVFLHGYTQAFARQVVRHKRQFGYKILLHGEFSTMGRGRTPVSRFLKYIYLKWFYSQVDHFLPIGSDATRHLQQSGIPDSRMTVAPYCVDDRFFEKQAASFDRSRCRDELGLRADQVAFLFSGKMIPRKNPLLLVEALRGLANDPRVAAIFVGDGELRGLVETTAKATLGNRAIFPGFVNQRDLGRYFKAADVLVLPSTFETWGLVVNEAMHFGLPCLVSDHVGCRLDLVEEGRTGYVFPSGDAGGLREKIGGFLNNPALCSSLGAEAHARVQGYTVEKAADAIERAARLVRSS
jgi:glycosyltransferase involved in cell wall biosynthesis